MLDRSFVVFICLLILAGCAYREEPVPTIVPGPTIFVPTPVQPRGKVVELRADVPRIDRNVPSDWLPPSGSERQWTAIVVHHSATGSGNAAIFDKWHRQGNNWDGVGYDFVIGNGSDSDDGEVEVTFRWREQRTGAHCKTPDNWANESAVGICLVGDFNNMAPSSRQMQSLVKLVSFLQNRYGISKSRIYGHNTTPGARVTDCPGKRFSMVRLKSMLQG